jgi:hypothetical protein
MMSTSNGGTRQGQETPSVDELHLSIPNAQPSAQSTAHSAQEACETDEKEQFLTLLHTEVRDLQSIIEMARRGEIKLVDHATYIGKSMQDICDIVEQTTPNTAALRHLHDLWDQMRECPILKDPAGFEEMPLDEQLAHFTLLNNQFRKIIFQISETEIPKQLNCWLEQSRTGYYIPFHTLFGDALPELEDRVKLLTVLAWTPGSVKGLVDVENGLIYRYADDRRERYVHLFLVLATLVISCVIAIGGGMLITDGTKSHLTFEMLTVSWFALLIGIVVHRATDALKGNYPPIIAIGEIGLLLSATHGRIIMKVFLALIAFFGLILMHATTTLTPFNAFLAGYSLDSVVEVFGNSLENRSAMQVAAFKQQLGLGS